MKKIKLKHKTRVIFTDAGNNVIKVLLCDTHAEALNILQIAEKSEVNAVIYDGDVSAGDFFLR